MAQKINLNQASEDELKQLEGISNSTAQAIVGEREQGGPFDGFDDLRRVNGISDQMIDKLRGQAEL